MSARQPSLKRRLIVQPFLLQAFILLLSIAALTWMALRLDIGGAYSDEVVVPVIAKAIVRRDDGGLAVRPTPELEAARRQTPSLWFVAVDAAGRAGVEVVDPTPWVCHDGDCPVVVGSTLSYRDSEHLTTEYAAALAAPLGRALGLT